jgi:sucrose-6-phosphate hydrolase SacC (GH32 family)
MADPYPFWNEDRKEYWMVVTLRKDGLPLNRAGAFGYATSRDMIHWTWQGELSSPGNIAEPELPSMFKIGQQWYLLGFPNDGKTLGEPTYQMSASCFGPWSKPVPASLDGKHFCAGRTAFDGCRRVLFGWIPRSILPAGGQQWGGHFALPRQLYPLPDRRLAVRLEPSIAQKISGERWFPTEGASLIPETGIWKTDVTRAAACHTGCRGTLRFQAAPQSVDLMLDVNLRDGCEYAGIVFGAAATNSNYTMLIDVHGRRLAVLNRDNTVRVQQAFDDLQGRKVHLRVLADGDIVEAFLDDRYALAVRMPESLTGARVALTARGPVDFEHINLCRLRDLDEIESPAAQPR